MHKTTPKRKYVVKIDLLDHYQGCTIEDLEQSVSDSFHPSTLRKRLKNTIKLQTLSEQGGGGGGVREFSPVSEPNF